MNAFTIIALVSAIHFPDTNLTHEQEVVNNLYNEVVAENRLVVGHVGHLTCVTLDLDGVPELKDTRNKEVECFPYDEITEEDIKSLFREGFMQSLKLRNELPLSIW